jgi:hypothetical protein
MRNAHIYFNLLLSGIATAVFATNCVVNGGDGNSDGTTCNAGDKASCTCGAGKTGERTCNSSGTGYGSCVCAGSTGGTGAGGDAAGGAANGSGGDATTNGGAAAGGEANATGGASSSYGGAAGESAGGAAAALDACDTCMSNTCSTELDACLADPTCFSDQADGSGQYEQVTACVEELRATQAVKRADLRDCGIVAISGTGFDWPPPEMAVTTTNVINCMAMGVPNDSTWADDANIDTPWPTTSCAKLSCTSQL